MAAIASTQEAFVIASINDQLFAVPVRLVQGMVPIPRVTDLPESPPFIRGVAILRGSTVLVVDLRLRMGMPSFATESQNYIEQLNLREQEHRHWLEELEGSVKEERPFSLPKDPHQCAFGRWYDNYEYGNSTHRCMGLDHVLLKFKNPHARIHAVADQVLGLADSGRHEKALDLIEKTRSDVLSKMINLFEEARATLTEGSRELLMVISNDNKQVALTVDTVESVETLSKDRTVPVSDLKMGLKDPLVSSICRRRKDDELVTVLDVSEFFHAAGERTDQGSSI